MKRRKEMLELQKLELEIINLRDSINIYEKEKLKLEIEMLRVSKRYSKPKFFIDLIQGLAILAGVFLAFNELVLKNRESSYNRQKLTLEYVQKIGDSAIVNSYNMLVKYRDDAIALPISKDSVELAFFSQIAEDFSKNTFALSQFYNVLYDGGRAGVFDVEIAQAFLSDDIRESIIILNELQSRHGGLNVKYTIPDYTRFRGLIKIYESRRHSVDEQIPRYSIGQSE